MPDAASAVDIPVTTTSDLSTDDEACSLREAIQAATTNTAIGTGLGVADCPAGALGQDDAIKLQAATYAISGSGDDNNTTGDFDLSSTGGVLAIDGATGANDQPLSTINAANLDRIFDVQPGGTPVITIQHVVLENGNTVLNGGAIHEGDDDAQFTIQESKVQDSHAGGVGGGIAVDSGAAGIDFKVNDVEFSGNTSDDDGGGLYVDVPQNFQVDVTRSSFIGNRAGGVGGGAYVKSPGSVDGPVLTFTNSTLSGNTASAGGGAVGFDFGMTGTAWFKFSTIAQNSTTTAAAGGGVFTNASTQFVLFQGGVIVSGNTAAGAASNCSGPGDFQTLGNNIDSGSSCLDAPLGTDLVNTDPLLAPLALNGGGRLISRTMGLYDSSPALNRIPPGSCSGAGGRDQRFVARPVGTNCDVGAFEGSVGPAPVTGGGGTPSATPSTTPAKKCKKKKKRTAELAKKKCKKKKKK